MTSSGPTACWRWLSGDLTGEERGRDRGNPLAGSSTVNRSGRARRGRDAPVQEGSGRSDGRSQACPSTLVRRREIFLDIDSTDDPVHGNQEGRHFHGYYDSYCYLPLYIVWDDLILCSRLRPANVDPAAGAEEELARERIRGRWPGTRIVVRGDGGFCRDDLMTWCEDNGVDYLFGLSRNARLTERIGRQLRKSRSRCVSTGAASRRFCDFRYRTRTSWSRTRRVVAKGLPGPRGLNARFVVTSLGCKRAGARVLYEKLYCARGEMENRIKEQQLDLFADRTSTATMRANQLRLDFATFASHGGDSEGWPGRHRGGQGAGRNDSDETSQGRRLHPHFGSKGSALVFVGLALEGSVRPGPGEPAGGCAAGPNLTPLAAPTQPFFESRNAGHGTGMFGHRIPRRRSCPQPQMFVVRSRKSPACRLRPASPDRRSSRKPRRQPGFGLWIRSCEICGLTPTSCQSRSSVCPFRGSRRDRRGAFAALVEEGSGRRDPEAFATFEVGLYKRLLGREVPGKCAEGRERRSGPPGRSGFLPVHRSDVENPRCRSRSPVRCTARREVRRFRRSTKARACSTPRSGGAQRSRAPVHAEERGRNLQKVGGHDSVVELSQASVGEGGQALEDEGGHGPRGGNGRSGLLRRLARRGSASLRRGRGSALGVQRDGQFPRRERHSPENVEFWAGNRKDDGAARRRGRPCPESAARRWSPTPRPTTGRFSKSSGLTSRQSTSFMPANISAKLPTTRSRPTGKTGHPARRAASTRSALPPRQGDDENGDRGS